MTKPFDEPIYVTRPFLPDLKEFQGELEQIWQSKWITNAGLKHEQLEEKLRDHLKVRGLSLFNNGTTALLAALKSLQIKGEVITTPFTFPATIHALTWTGSIPVFCDIDNSSMNIDANLIEQYITSETAAILAVHVFGTPCDVSAIRAIADQHNLKVVYDAAHAFDVEIDEKGIGEFGDISMFSFHATKLFHTGEGGALTYRDPELQTKIDLIKNFGIVSEDEVVLPGINGKMTEMQAALGIVNLRHVMHEREKRRRIADAYMEHLAGIEGISFHKLPENVRQSYQYFAIRVDQEAFGISRDDLNDTFRRFNVYSRKYFHPLCSSYEHYRHLPSADRGNLPVAHKVSKEILCLPMYGALGVGTVAKLCEIIAEARG